MALWLSCMCESLQDGLVLFPEVTDALLQPKRGEACLLHTQCRLSAEQRCVTRW